MEKKPLNNDDWRFERKYSLNPVEFIQFEKLLLTSNLETLYPDRTINNCYLDDYENTSYIESEDGLAEKMKIRVRWYGNDFGIKEPILEFKIKQNHSNKKESFRLPKINIDDSFNWEEYINDIRGYLKTNNKFNLPQRLEPVLINSYYRSYYSDIQKSFRLTIDHQLTFSKPSDIFKSSEKIDRYIIELKYQNTELIADFPIQNLLGKFSKFTTGLNIIN